MAAFTLDEVQRRIHQFADRFKADPEHEVVITDRGIPSMVLISWDRYESLVETEEVRHDAVLVDAIEKGSREIDEGKGLSWKEAQKKLGRH